MAERILSHYKVLEEISSGGMGIVYRAVDTKLDREVAIKVLPPELVADPERKRRFVQEAKAAAALHHPHIATIFEIDEA
ncbi:MAG TPA: protein kinase, partial [Vicinamibacteria bacterium]|nr:protein kinase [Vicinamibacteria bacterium]